MKATISAKILLFFVTNFAAIFATFALYFLWMLACVGAGYMQLETVGKIEVTPMGQLGSSLLTIMVGSSGCYLLIAIWIAWSFLLCWIFQEELTELSNRIRRVGDL